MAELLPTFEQRVLARFGYRRQPLEIDGCGLFAIKRGEICVVGIAVPGSAIEPCLQRLGALAFSSDPGQIRIIEEPDADLGDFGLDLVCHRVLVQSIVRESALSRSSSFRSRSSARARVGPMLPIGMPKAADISS